MDKETKLAIKRMRDIQKIRAGYAKKLTVLETNLTKLGWEITVGEAASDDAAMGVAARSVDQAILSIQSALNALSRVEPEVREVATPTPIASQPPKVAE